MWFSGLEEGVEGSIIGVRQKSADQTRIPAFGQDEGSLNVHEWVGYLGMILEPAAPVVWFCYMAVRMIFCCFAGWQWRPPQPLLPTNPPRPPS